MARSDPDLSPGAARTRLAAGYGARVAGPAVLALALAGALTACAGYGPAASTLGSTEAQIVQQMGPPTGRYTGPEGQTRLEFARGPFGKHTWMIDLDAQGRAVRVEQVLTEAHLQTMRDGDRAEDVLRRFGRPSEVRSGGFQGGQVWSWRYDANNNCLWFEVSVRDGVVRQPGHAIDPSCDVGGNERD